MSRLGAMRYRRSRNSIWARVRMAHPPQRSLRAHQGAPIRTEVCRSSSFVQVQRAQLLEQPLHTSHREHMPPSRRWQSRPGQSVGQRHAGTLACRRGRQQPPHDGQHRRVKGAGLPAAVQHIEATGVHAPKLRVHAQLASAYAALLGESCMRRACLLMMCREVSQVVTSQWAKVLTCTSSPACARAPYRCP